MSTLSPLSPLLDVELVLDQLASLPVEVHERGSVVLAAGGTTGKLLILKEGAVEVVRGGVRLAEVSEPGAVFGELALLLGRPHTADVRALQRSTFHVADGRSFLEGDPTAALYVAVVLAGRLDLVNRYLIEARNQLKPAERGSVLDQMIDNIAQALRFGPPM